MSRAVAVTLYVIALVAVFTAAYIVGLWVR